MCALTRLSTLQQAVLITLQQMVTASVHFSTLPANKAILADWKRHKVCWAKGSSVHNQI